VLPLATWRPLIAVVQFILGTGSLKYNNSKNKMSSKAEAGVSSYDAIEMEMEICKSSLLHSLTYSLAFSLALFGQFLTRDDWIFMDLLSKEFFALQKEIFIKTCANGNWKIISFDTEGAEECWHYSPQTETLSLVKLCNCPQVNWSLCPTSPASHSSLGPTLRGFWPLRWSCVCVCVCGTTSIRQTCCLYPAQAQWTP